MNIKDIIIGKIIGLKSIQTKAKRFDDIREELNSICSQNNFENLTETVWNILNDFPEHKCLNCGLNVSFKSYQIGYKKFCNVKCSNQYKGKDEKINFKIKQGVKKFNEKQNESFWDKRSEKYRNTLLQRSSKEKEYYKEKKI